MELHLLKITYLDDLRMDNYSDGTIKRAENHIRMLVNYLKKFHHIEDSQGIYKAVLKGFIDYLRKLKSKNTGDPLKRRTIYSICLTIKAFLQYLVTHEYLFADYSAIFELRKEPRSKPKNVPTEGRMKKILNAPDETTYLGFRDKVILELMYNTGLRRSEVAHLDLYDVNYEEQTIFVNQGKGKKDRVVPMGTYLERYLHEYIEKVRPVLIENMDDTCLFVNNQGRPMLPANLNTMTARYARKLDFKFNCHSLRHALATHLLKHGAGLLYIQRILGHADPRSTEIYTKVYPTDLKTVIADFHPRSIRTLSQEKIELPTKRKNTQIGNFKRKLQKNDDEV